MPHRRWSISEVFYTAGSVDADVLGPVLP